MKKNWAGRQDYFPCPGLFPQLKRQRLDLSCLNWGNNSNNKRQFNKMKHIKQQSNHSARMGGKENWARGRVGKKENLERKWAKLNNIRREISSSCYHMTRVGARVHLCRRERKSERGDGQKELSARVKTEQEPSIRLGRTMRSSHDGSSYRRVLSLALSLSLLSLSLNNIVLYVSLRSMNRY